MLVVVHTSPRGTSRLANILDRVGQLAARAASDGEAVLPGVVYVARPNRHLLVDGEGRIRLSDGPRESRVRPAVDPLFRSIAARYGQRAVGVVLSGTSADGALGLLEIRRRGGLTLVQDPRQAAFGAMPANAIRAVGPDLVDSVEAIAGVLVEGHRTGAPVSAARADEGR